MERQLLNVAGAASIAAVNAAGVSADQGDHLGALALILVLDVTTLVGTGTPSLQLIVELLDRASGKYIALLTAVAVTATGTYTYLIALGVAVASEGITAVRGFAPPDSYRVRVVGGGATITSASFTVASHKQ